MSHSLEISKDEINKLDLYIFPGKIHLIESDEAAKAAIKDIKLELSKMSVKILGFDTETRAAFKKGENYNISLLQLATDKNSYLFRLNRSAFSSELAQILSDAEIIKTGVAVRDDIKGLQKLISFEPKNFIDLSTVATEKGIKNIGLRALTAIFLQKRLSKKAKISNWEVNRLTEIQINYAACDAVVGYEIYKKMMT